MSQRKGSSGLPLMEIAMVASVAAILMTVFLHYSLYYVELSEKSAMDLLVTHMRSGLRLEKARLYTNGREHEMQKLADTNPILWLKNLPNNYLGERSDISPKAIPAGKWLFNPQNHTLYYQPQRHRYLYRGTTLYQGTIQFKMTLSRLPETTSNNADVFREVEITSITPYHWF